MSIAKLGMPKWGLSMREGALVSWLVEEGAVLSLGDDVAEVETEKINGIVEAPEAGLLRRRVAQVGDVVPVGGLLGVLADASVSDDEIDAFVADFAATFVPEDELDDEGPLLETLTVGGTSVSYSRHGGGTETLVLLHGFGGDMTTWLFNHEAISSADRTVIAPDLPGHGSSSKEVAVGDLAELTGAVSALLDGLGAERVDLASHSLGGAVASAVALQQPGRVRSLTLVASAGLGPEVNADFADGFVERANKQASSTRAHASRRGLGRRHQRPAFLLHPPDHQQTTMRTRSERPGHPRLAR